MADKHPYVTSPGSLAKVIGHLRRSFPQAVTAETLRKLGFAPKNESYVINVLRFLGLIDEKGTRVPNAQKVFSHHEDSSFQRDFAALVKRSYSDLFELHGENAWALERNTLITFFRSSDQTTAIVGKFQASTFLQLAGFSGHEAVRSREPASKKEAAILHKAVRKQGLTAHKASPPSDKSKANRKGQPPTVGLTVRIEVNLPADGDQETYDRIFRSIRENLINE
jgi:hypothetical protein